MVFIILQNLVGIGAVVSVITDFGVDLYLQNINVCSFVKKNTVGRRRRNSFFVSGVSRSKMIMLQISGLSDEVSTTTAVVISAAPTGCPASFDFRTLNKCCIIRLHCV